ncbi:MAG: outer membrane protein assembly factor [Marinilabiliales bacterium]|nr:MAG: outer membrane protein assembly factor [Marinilabiliales bacterium]
MYIYNLIDPVKEAQRQEERKAKLDEINRERRWEGKPPKDKFYFTEWLQNIGEEPVIYDEYLATKTARQFSLYLRNKGYYSAQVEDSVYFKRKKAYLIYKIYPKKPYKIRKVEYNIEDKKLRDFVLLDTSDSYIKRGNNLDVDLLQKEREKITYHLKKNGYYAFMKEYIDYQVDTSIAGSAVDLILRIKNPQSSGYGNENHKQYYIADIKAILNYDPKKAIQQRDIYISGMYSIDRDGITYMFDDQLPVKTDVVARAIDFKKGELYNIHKVERTYKYLNNIGLYKLSNIIFSPIEGSDSLSCQIHLTPFLKQSTITEVEGTNTSGNLGVAANWKYVHKSLFKGAEYFEMKFKGAMQKQTTISEVSVGDEVVPEYLPFNTVEIGPESSIRFPKMLLPFKLKKFTKAYHPKTTISTAYNFQHRPDYTRTIANAKMGYFWSGKRNITYFVTPVELNFIKLTKIDPEFEERINDSYLRFSYKDQMITSLNYTMVFSNQSLKKSKSFIYFKAGLESAGNLLDAVNSSNDNLSVTGSNTIFDVAYAQYMKFDIDFNYHAVLNPENKIVYRNFIGVGYPYGNSDAMPFVKQYFCGGANSIRAWPVRSLGPGTFKDTSSISRYPIQSADMKLEANIEYRFDVIAMLEGAFFVDVGNIWSLNSESDRPGGAFSFSSFYKDIAVGAGMGARFDLDFFILRLDFGYKILDPSQPEGERIGPGNRPFSNDQYSWNLAIGYPF